MQPRRMPTVFAVCYKCYTCAFKFYTLLRMKVAYVIGTDTANRHKLFISGNIYHNNITIMYLGPIYISRVPVEWKIISVCDVFFEL